jgi:O-antigen/teichoic acid export membrane protein
MRISIIASVGSGLIAVIMAYMGYGVWSLVALSLGRFGFNSLFFWIWSKWRPSKVFSKKSFYELFSFGSKLLASGLLDTIYRNVYNLVIGKYFSAIQLGYYTMADQFQALPSQNLTGVIGRVSYPVLSTIQDDIPKLKTAYKKIIKSSMLLSFIFMFGMAAIAEPLIITLMGEKWLPSVFYLQLLCFVGMIYPLHALNLNILQVKGRSDLFLRLEIQKKILIIPVIFIGIFWGIKTMILGMIVINLIAFYLNSYWSGKFIDYSTTQQIRDIFPSFLVGLFVGLLVFISGHFLNVSDWLKLLIQIFIGAALTIGILEAIKLVDYFYIKEIIFEKIFKRK